MTTRILRHTTPILFVTLALTAGCGSDNDFVDLGGPQIQQGTLLTLADGMIEGEIDEGARRFLGIPFAAPPVGEQRWRPPAAPNPWTGVLDATELSAACPQNDGLTTSASDNEDCLYLNVWTPEPAPSELLPVMLWFHGGANVSGSTADEVPLGVGGLFYDGKDLAGTRDVVVVTTNYRLGLFGFFAHDALAAEDPSYPYSGNQGLLDQVAALEWVRDHIEAFGGDPNNVTIFGESAGAFDVCFQVVSPLGRGLFHRAISQSGGCTGRISTNAEALARTQTLAEDLGCNTASDELDCLRSNSVTTLLERSVGFIPTVDGGVLPDQPRAMFDRGDFAKVPYILGSNRDEWTLFALGSSEITTEEEFLAQLELSYPGRSDEIAAVYPLEEFANPNDAWIRALGDAGLVCGTYDSGRRAAAGGADVYLYNFSRPVLVDILPQLGATHGAEIAFVFGSSAAAGNGDDLALSESMQGYWTRFARSGDPNGDGALTWPRYSDTEDVRINFDVENTLVDNFRRAQCEVWWDIIDEQFE